MRSTLLVLAGVFQLLVSSASAQTGAGLLFKPWDGSERFEFDARAALFADGEVEDSGIDEDVQLSIYESQGRFKLNGEKESPFAVGYSFYYLNISSSDDALPNRLVDQQVAAGAELFHCDGWAVSIIAGLGYASSNPFADSDALYGRGDIVATRKIDEQSSIQVGLTYDGNRPFLPDVPLPGFAYMRKVSDTFSYTLGLPYSSFRWVPYDRWYVQGTLTPVPSIDVEVGYVVARSWPEGATPTVTIYGSFSSETRAFHVDGDDPHRRVFFKQSLLEVGVRWKACPTCEIIVAGGFAFEQEFTRGWDTRDDEDVREISDEPFVRIGGRIRF